MLGTVGQAATLTGSVTTEADCRVRRVWVPGRRAEGTGTRLFLRHAGFAAGSPALKGMGNGWPGLLRRIGAALG